MNKIEPEIRRDIIDQLIDIGKWTGDLSVTEFAKRVYPNVENLHYSHYSEKSTMSAAIRRHMDDYHDWKMCELLYDKLKICDIADDDFLHFCQAYVQPAFKRFQKVNNDDYDEDPEYRNLNEDCVKVINSGLFPLGYRLELAQEGKQTYEMKNIRPAPKDTIKNIIFIPEGKPDIVIGNALTNQVVVNNAAGALIYDRGVPIDGISWKYLVDWYCSLKEGNTEETMKQLFDSRLDSLVEKRFFNGYIDYLKKRGPNIPALIPQVYLYYDPKTAKERNAKNLEKVFEHQRMDFMMIIRPEHRIVIEIDGQQHYAETGYATEIQHKYYASPTLYAEMMKAHREMSLAGYDVYRFGGKELWINPNDEINSKRIVLNTITKFFDDLFEKYGIDET